MPLTRWSSSSTRWCETRRQEAVKHVLSRLGGKLSNTDCAATEKAFNADFREA
jgi:hypothetical protein